MEQDKQKMNKTKISVSTQTPVPNNLEGHEALDWGAPINIAISTGLATKRDIELLKRILSPPPTFKAEQFGSIMEIKPKDDNKQPCHDYWNQGRKY